MSRAAAITGAQWDSHGVSYQRVDAGHVTQLITAPQHTHTHTEITPQHPCIKGNILLFLSLFFMLSFCPFFLFFRVSPKRPSHQLLRFQLLILPMVYSRHSSFSSCFFSLFSFPTFFFQSSSLTLSHLLLPSAPPSFYPLFSFSNSLVASCSFLASFLILILLPSFLIRSLTFFPLFISFLTAFLLLSPLFSTFL